ncbi:MAG: flagellar basal body rod protein FlgC [Pseudomonadota bacterium]
MSDHHLSTMAVASSAMRAQSLRVRLASENLANANSPEYQRRTVVFEVTNPNDDMRDVDFVGIRKVGRDRSEFSMKYDPSNPLANQEGYVVGSNVNSLVEMTNAREANRSYEASLNMFDQARMMQNNLIDLLRR